MEAAIILKIAGVGLLVSIAHMILNRAGRDEMAMLVSLAGVIVILVMLLDELSALLDTVRNIFGI